MKMEVGYTKQELQQAQQEQRQIHAMAGKSRVMKDDTFVARRIHPKLYANGIRKTGDRKIWSNPEFVRDMERLHPEIACAPCSGKIMVGGRGFGGAATNRFGRVSLRVRYTADGERIEERF